MNNLSRAVMKQDYALIKKALKKGADVNQNNGELLRYAIMLDDLQLVKMLVDSGANPDSTLDLLDSVNYAGRRICSSEIFAYLRMVIRRRKIGELFGDDEIERQ